MWFFPLSLSLDSYLQNINKIKIEEISIRNVPSEIIVFKSVGIFLLIYRTTHARVIHLNPSIIQINKSGLD